VYGLAIGGQVFVQHTVMDIIIHAQDAGPEAGLEPDGQ